MTLPNGKDLVKLFGRGAWRYSMRTSIGLPSRAVGDGRFLL